MVNRFTFSWAAVGSVMICPSLSMAQVTPQNRQLIGSPASIRVIQAAFKKHDKSWKTVSGRKLTEKHLKETISVPWLTAQHIRELFFFPLKDTEPSSCNTCKTRVREERGWSDRSRDASQVSRTHCSCDRSLTPGKKQKISTYIYLI